MMIDFARKKMNYLDIDTGEIIDCQAFVAILPFSGLIFCRQCIASVQMILLNVLTRCCSFMKVCLRVYSVIT